MREDFRIINDGRSFSVMTRDRAQNFAESDQLAPIVAEHKAIAVNLGADDYFTGRLVVAENLTELESTAWIAKVHRPLQVGEGGILIAGGCDCSCYYDWIESQPAKIPAQFQETVHFDVPPGNYIVEIYAYFGSYVASEVLFDEDDDSEPFKSYVERWPQGPFFKETFEEAQEIAEEDEYAAQMVELVNQSKAELLESGEDNMGLVGYLFHMQEISKMNGEVDQTDEEGWMEFGTHTHIPERLHMITTALPVDG